jgi:hypothetical protein
MRGGKHMRTIDTGVFDTQFNGAEIIAPREELDIA